MFVIHLKPAVSIDRVTGGGAFVAPLSSVLVEKEEDLSALSGPQLVAAFNMVPGVKPVARFADSKAGRRRLWAVLRDFPADQSWGPKAAEPPVTKQSSGETKEDESVAAKKKNGKPKKVAKKRAPSDKPRTLKNKSVPKASKVYPLKPGSVQEKLHRLLSRKNGVSVDELVKEMNEGPGKAKWKRGNAWSSIVYTLHTSHGYGAKIEDGRYYIIE